MIRRAALVGLLAGVCPALAAEAMPATEREAYLEACLAVALQDPALSAYQRLGTGEVTPGHASVALFDFIAARAVTVDCQFVQPFLDSPQAERISITAAGKIIRELEPAEANSLIAKGAAAP